MSDVSSLPLNVSVLGGGAWGTALAVAAAEADESQNILLWAREEEVVADINSRHINGPFLNGVTLPDRIHATADLSDLSRTDLLIMVPPAQHLRTVLSAALPYLKPNCILAICSKGIEASSGKLLSDVVAEIAAQRPVAILSGPTFAIEVAKGLPCALTVASQSAAVSEALIGRLGRASFRLYASTDVVGAQIGGAVKNVLAIAAGIVHGMALGDNARAALITRGLAEIMRFGAAHGADTATLAGLSGLGDLLLTCSSLQSRNMSLGYELGSGKSFADIMATRTTVAEGAHSVTIVAKLAQQLNIDMPITHAVNAIVHQGADAKYEMRQLLARPFKEEI